MGRLLRLSLLTRPEVERLVMHYHQVLVKVVGIVRDDTKPDWKVARDVEKILAEDRDGSLLDRALTRQMDAEQEARRAERNESRWAGWGEESLIPLSDVRQPSCSDRPRALTDTGTSGPPLSDGTGSHPAPVGGLADEAAGGGQQSARPTGTGRP